MYRIIWSRKALRGYAAILAYLDENWTAREIKNFEKEIKDFLDLLSNNPHILQSTGKELRRGPINKLTMLTYQLNNEKKEIQLLSLRSSLQKPE